MANDGEIAVFDPPGPVGTSTILDAALKERWDANGYLIWKTQQTSITLYDDLERGHKVVVKAVKRTNASRDRYQMLKRNYQRRMAEGGKVMLSTEQSILREIAIMKACRHAHIVRLLAVVDDPRKNWIYMTMEYSQGGRVVWQDDDQRPVLTVSQVRRIFRDVVVGLEYLHYMGIIHRDIKPDNLIWSEDRSHVKIIDFGISYFNPSIRKVPFARWRKQLDSMKDLTLFPPNDLTKLRGTDYFIAPEIVNVSDNDPSAADPSTTSLTSQAAASSSTIPMQSVTGTSVQTVSNASAPHLPPPSNASAEQLPVPSPPAPSPPASLSSPSRPPITKAIDVWALAVTLYCFLFGKLPFDNPPDSERFNVNHRRFLLYKEICTKDWVAPDEMGANPPMATGGRYPNDEFSVIRLLDRMLQKDPRRRVTLQDVKKHPWVTTDIPHPAEWLEETSPAQYYRPRPYRYIRRIVRQIYEKISPQH